MILRIQGTNKNTIPDLSQMKIKNYLSMTTRILLTANMSRLEYPDKILLHDMNDHGLYCNIFAIISYLYTFFSPHINTQNVENNV